MDKAAEKILRELAEKRGLQIVVDETRPVTRITANQGRRGAVGSLSYVTAQPIGKSEVDKPPER